MKMQINIIPFVKINKSCPLVVLIFITAGGPVYCLEQSDMEVKLLFVT